MFISESSEINFLNFKFANLESYSATNFFIENSLNLNFIDGEIKISYSKDNYAVGQILKC